MAGQNLDERLKPIAADVERLNLWMIALIVVLFIGFAAMFGTIATIVISHFDSGQAKYQELTNQVNAQNDKIDLILKQTAK